MIRHAVISDVPAIVALVKLFYPNTPYAKQGDFDEATVTDLTINLVCSGIVLVAQREDSGELVGILGTVIAPYMYNSNILGCNEAIWWVLPEYQKTGIGIKLLERVDQIRKLRGCKFFQMMRTADSPASIDSILTKAGFEPSEYCFTKVD